MQKYNNTRIIIGLDHGYGNIKTAHRIFRTGVECFEEEPIVSMNYIKYKDKYYVIGENHLIYQGNKTDSQDFFVLTLAGLAEELKFRGMHEAKVVLAVGLSDGELREKQTANYFSDIYPIDCAVLSANAQSCPKCCTLLPVLLSA